VIRLRVLVTGGAGFIGSHFVEEFMKKHKVYVFDNLERCGDVNLKEIGFNMERLYEGEIEVHYDFNDCRKCILRVKPHVIIHTAAQVGIPTSVHHPLYDMDVNIGGTINICQACVEAGIKPYIVFTSSRAVYGEPEYLPVDENHPIKANSQYGISKYAAEQYLLMYMREYGLKPIILRLTTIYGERQYGMEEQGIVAWMIKCVLEGKTFNFFGDAANFIRDPTYVKDVVKIAKAAIEKDMVGEVFNVGTGSPVRLGDLLNLIEMIAGKKIKKRRVKPREADVTAHITDTSKMLSKLRCYPDTPLWTGLERTINWAKKAWGYE